MFLVMLPLVAFQAKPTRAEAPLTPSVKDLIITYADKYNTDETVLLKVAKCESGLKTNVYGDGGKAYSVFQYHQKTFDRFSDLFGKDLDYKSAEDQIELTAWVFAEHPELRKHWSCWTKFYR